MPQEIVPSQVDPAVVAYQALSPAIKASDAAAEAAVDAEAALETGELQRYAEFMRSEDDAEETLDQKLLAYNKLDHAADDALTVMIALARDLFDTRATSVAGIVAKLRAFVEIGDGADKGDTHITEIADELEALVRSQAVRA